MTFTLHGSKDVGAGEMAWVGEVPIPTTTVGGDLAVQGFFFQDFGVRLDVRPTLADDGFITIEPARPKSGVHHAARRVSLFSTRDFLAAAITSVKKFCSIDSFATAQLFYCLLIYPLLFFIRSTVLLCPSPDPFMSPP